MISPGRISPELLAELRARTPLVPLVGRHTKLNRSGSTWKGCCPFHPDKTPSFHVYPDGHFHCFGCGAHGDQIEFMRRIEGVGFIDAFNRLAVAAGMDAAPSSRNGDHAGR